MPVDAPPSNPLTRPLFAVLGVLCVVLATIGIVVPGLPTTPLLLAAAYLFARSSPRMHDWLIQHRWFGPYIRAVRDERALPLRAKVTTLVLLWASIVTSIVLLSRSGTGGPVAIISLVVVGLSVSWIVGSWLRTAPAPSPAAAPTDPD